jgi:HemY protein
VKGLLWLTLLFALAVGLSLAAHYNDGYVLLVLPPYRVELTLNLVAALVAGGFIVFYAVLRAIAATLALPRRVRAYRARQRGEKAAAAYYDVARLLFEGRYGQAARQAGAAYAAGLSPALAALLAAYAALSLREPAKAQLWLERARAADARMQHATLMLEAQLHLDARRFDAARDALRRLHEAHGLHIAALRLQLLAEQGSGNWREAQRIAHLLETRNALSAAEAEAIRRQADRHEAEAIVNERT